MNARTISAILSAMLPIATALARSPLQESAQERVPSSTQTAPDVVDLLKSARSAYLKGDYAAAHASLEQAWGAIQQSPSSEPKRYDIAKQLSAVLSAAGDYAAAQEYQQVAIDWREANMGPDDPKLPEEWVDLATLCQRQKDFRSRTRSA